ncbi:hypothetical protein [Stenotrophomonas maltophilia]|uniref:hypothetical protein n=1 Tax=Stenotrophomonas maltophilia TaxID=40324 RepID=UPI001D12346B|nr:hypothetical protein [Stenotrophomonas maltophilia]UXB37692.1 hypothetical protein K7563_07955 [Stenotrophomonas maltophilia]
MSTDKTLADVQPGGRVRLGDQEFAQGCDELRMRTDGERSAYLEGVAEGRRAALSAQPSPGGQGMHPPYWPEVDRILVDAYVAGSEGDEFDMIAARTAIHAAIAARQPVGEPVAVIENGAFGGGGLLWIGPMPPIGTKLYAAPPAQAVDLAENMLSVLIEEGVLARNGRVFQKLRALIDSMAVGNG